ncbi:MAG: translation initiation factor IF-2 [Peptococcaceae bacterium]|nr:translation initiation factor IF-2 [Peptococcaceae bacterium]
MAKKRVHELARELKIESKEVINRLNDMGVAIKSHMSTVEENDIERLREVYLKDAVGAKKSDISEKFTEAEQSVSSTGRQVRNEKKGALSEQRPFPGRDKQYKEEPGRGGQRGQQGVVGRVPSRPPDRRFHERQSTGSSKPKSTKRRDQFFKPMSDGQQEKTPTRRDVPARLNRVQQEPRRQDPSTAKVSDSQARIRTSPTGTVEEPAAQKRQAAPQTRPARRGTPQPGGTQDARTKQADRQDSIMDTMKLSPESPRIDDRSRMPAEKAKTAEKTKQARAKKTDSRSRFEKKGATAHQAEPKPRSGAQRKRGPARAPKKVQRPAKPVEKKPVVIGRESVTVQELSLKMHKSPAELIKRLMQLGVLATINQEIDIDTATILAGEFGYEVEVKLPVDMEAVLMQEPEDSPELMEQRASVVTVMGHVDHGKTSLLDAIRESNVIATEAGGITQHIGAYQIEHKGKKITFIDTPGHEAFTAMRARGAQVTDIAILVVAADDGVMPQTVEAINHAKDAGVPIIVAVNKIDKPGANPDKVRQELTEHGLVSEEWGGDTICVNVSAAKKEGIVGLLEMILLVAEVEELKANANRPARGTVIEAELDRGRGPVASVLVQNGTLNVGDTIIAGAAIGRVRAMMDDKGRRIKKAGPSTPVEVIGFSEVPAAGDVFIVTEDEKLARNIVSKRQSRRRDEELRTSSKVSLEDLFKHIQEGQIKELGIIVKADVQGSVEALQQALERLNTGEVKVNIIHGGVGAIRETDVMFASASNAIIIGFNVRPDVNARKAAESEKVDIRLYRVIYDAIEDVKAAMSGLLDPEYREVELGSAEIRKIFKASKIGTIAGCYVVEGKIERDAGVRVVRDGIVVYEGKLESLKRFKDDVKEVLQGYECGLAIEKYNEIEEGDVIEAFRIEAIRRQLS